MYEKSSKTKFTGVVKYVQSKKYDVRTGACKPCACGWDEQEQSISWLSVAISTCRIFILFYFIFFWLGFLKVKIFALS